MKITLSFELINEPYTGEKLTISDGINELWMFHPKYGSIPLVGLTEAVIRILNGTDSETYVWNDEGALYHWLLERNCDELAVTIWSGRQEGEPEFAATCKVRRFALQLKNVLADASSGYSGREVSFAHDKLQAVLTQTTKK